jgi:hypothetical protein
MKELQVWIFEQFDNISLLRLFQGTPAKSLHRADILTAIRKVGPPFFWTGAHLDWLLKVIVVLGKMHFSMINIAEKMEMVNREFVHVLSGDFGVNLFVDLPSHCTQIRIADSKVYK